MTADPDPDDLPDVFVALRERVDAHHAPAELRDAVLRDLPDREARRPWAPRRLGARARVAIGLAAMWVPSSRSTYILAAFILSYIGGLLTNHQYNVSASDQFLQQTIPTILNSVAWKDTTQRSAIFITFDEDSDNLSLGFANQGNHVVTVVIPSPGAVSDGMRSGNFIDTSYANHYSLLRTIEDSLKLEPLTKNDAYAAPLNNFWGTPPVTP